eukprot:8720165-Pyramimonas_sp.AAC.1
MGATATRSTRAGLTLLRNEEDADGFRTDAEGSFTCVLGWDPLLDRPIPAFELDEDEDTALTTKPVPSS